MIEIELRGTLTSKRFKILYTFLTKTSSEKMQDNKITYFFVLNRNILKVSRQEAYNYAEITFKIGDETQNILEEIHIPIHSDMVDKTVNFFKMLGYKQVNKVHQERTNFKYKGVNISLKYTDDWKYHFEIDDTASNYVEAKIKKQKLTSISKELGLKIMSKVEIARKIRGINKKHGFITN